MFLIAALLTDGQYDENVSHRCSDLWVVGFNRLGEERGTWVEACLVGVPFNLFITIQPFHNGDNEGDEDNMCS